MSSMSVLSCRCCMFVSCVHPVVVLSAAFCMTCSLLMLFEDEKGDHMEECFVIQMLYVCVMCASCGSSQCCLLHDLQFVNAGRGCNRRPYRRD